jgi:hypothetical protein
MTFCASRFALGRRRRSPGSQDLSCDMLSRSCIGQIGYELNDADGEVNQPFFKFVGLQLRVFRDYVIFHILNTNVE